MTTTGRQVTELIYDYLAEVGPELNTTSDRGFRKRLADRWEWSADSLAIAFHINPDARWHDGHAVGANDVRFTFRVYTDSILGSPTRGELAGIDSVTARDSLTAVFWFRARSPLQFFHASSEMQILPMHVFGGMSPDSLLKVSSRLAPVGSGRFHYVRWRAKESIEIDAEAGNYRGSPGIARLIWRITPSAATATSILFAGDADVYDAMRPENVVAAARTHEVRIVSSPGASYAFMGFNFREPKAKNRPHHLFSSKELRRALSMAVDRQRMVTNVFDSLALPGIGPTIRAFPVTDTLAAQIPYDPARAAQILDSLGWRLNASTGIRERAGTPLQFRLLLPQSSLNRQRMAVLLQDQLKSVGVSVLLDELEFTAAASRLAARDFDAVLWSWNLGTSPEPGLKMWTTRAASSEDGLNFGSYSSARFDRAADSATSSMNPEEMRRLYKTAYSIIGDDAPAIWLYEPRTVLGVRNRVRTSAVRIDAWWYSLADWSVR